MYEILDELEKLREKSTPKKLRMMRIKKFDGADIGECACGNCISREEYVFPELEVLYCSQCGQAILWEDENEKIY
mgnify:CR=1 FL=1